MINITPIDIHAIINGVMLEVTNWSIEVVMTPNNKIATIATFTFFSSNKFIYAYVYNLKLSRGSSFAQNKKRQAGFPVWRSVSL